MPRHSLLTNLLLLQLTWVAFAKQIPSYVHLCKRNDPEVAKCFVQTLYDIMPHLVKGIPEMDVPSIDPLAFTSILVNTGNTNSVSITVDLTNGTVEGLKNLKVTDNVMDFDNIKFSANLFIPRVKLEGNYKINGKILLFELNGDGLIVFNATDVLCKGVWMGNTHVKKGKTHINIDKIVFSEVQLKNMKIRLDNLFRNDQVLTDTVNNAINENIDTLREELQPLITETLSELIRDYFNRVYRLFSIDQLYPIA